MLPEHFHMGLKGGFRKVLRKSLIASGLWYFLAAKFVLFYPALSSCLCPRSRANVVSGRHYGRLLAHPL